MQTIVQAPAALIFQKRVGVITSTDKLSVTYGQFVLPLSSGPREVDASLWVIRPLVQPPSLCAGVSFPRTSHCVSSCYLSPDLTPRIIMIVIMMIIICMSVIFWDLLHSNQTRLITVTVRISSLCCICVKVCVSEACRVCDCVCVWTYFLSFSHSCW